MEKVQSAKSELTEAFPSLLIGFEVSDIVFCTSILHVCVCVCVCVCAHTRAREAKPMCRQ